MASEEITVRDRIIERAQELFFVRGFCTVTTDEVAAGLGISKKTLYQHFASKEALLRACMHALRDELAGEFARVIDDPHMDFPEKLRGVMTALATRMARMQRPHFEDMHRKAPAMVREMEQFRRERVLPMFERLFEEGERKGMLRSDIDPHLFMQMFYTLVEGLGTPNVLLHLPCTLSDLFRSILTVLLEGMLTDEGRRQFSSTADTGRKRVPARRAKRT